MYSLSLYVRAPRGSVKTCCPFHSSRIPLQPRSAAAGCVAGPAGGAQDGASPPPSAGTTPAAPPVPVDAATADDVAVGDRGQSRATSRLTNVAACRLVCAGFFFVPPARPPPRSSRPRPPNAPTAASSTAVHARASARGRRRRGTAPPPRAARAPGSGRAASRTHSRRTRAPSAGASPCRGASGGVRGAPPVPACHATRRRPRTNTGAKCHGQPACVLANMPRRPQDHEATRLQCAAK